MRFYSIYELLHFVGLKRWGHRLLLRAAKSHLDAQRLDEALDLLSGSKRDSTQSALLSARAMESKGDQATAVSILLKAQKRAAPNFVLLLRIADLFKKDARVHLAEIYLRAATRLNPISGQERTLLFEVENNMEAKVKVTLAAMLNLPDTTLIRHLPTINRSAALVPELGIRVAETRLRLHQNFRQGITNADLLRKEQLSIAIKCRWRQEFHTCYKALEWPRSRKYTRWWAHINANLKGIEELIDIATYNEEHSIPISFRNRVIQPVSLDTLDLGTTIELFIPTVFFADPDQEKPSYSTVRYFFLSLYETVLSLKDWTVIPRHQFNWRYCSPTLKGAKAISYHTHSTYSLSHLHIQESPLAGRCSIDHQGFAGFASIATKLHVIEEQTKHVSASELQATHEVLHEAYARKNVSKYTQTEKRKNYSGNYVFVALQIRTDVVASLATIESLDLLKTVAHYYKGSKTKVIAKRHPYCGSMSMQSTLQDLEADGLIEISSASVHDLIANAQMVFTVNSGVGLETLLHLKPVVVTGDCDYAYAAIRAHTRDDLIKIMEEPVAVDKTRILRFLHYYYRRHTISATNSTQIADRISEWVGMGLPNAKISASQ